MPTGASSRNHLRGASPAGASRPLAGQPQSRAARTARHCAEATPGCWMSWRRCDRRPRLAGAGSRSIITRHEIAVACAQPEPDSLARTAPRACRTPDESSARDAARAGPSRPLADDMRPQVCWPGVVALRHGDRLWLIRGGRACSRHRSGPLEWPDPREPLLALGPVARVRCRWSRSTAGGLRCSRPPRGALADRQPAWRRAAASCACRDGGKPLSLRYRRCRFFPREGHRLGVACRHPRGPRPQGHA
jgi:hypothetical protein